jgi:lipopolysaccharide export system protein LptC
MNQNTAKFACLLLGLSISLARAGAPDLGVLILKDFRTRSADQTDPTGWEVTGKRAEVRGSIATLQQVQVVLNGKTAPATITSPDCVFNRSTNLVTSKAPLHLVSKQMTLDGVGYDLDPQKQTLHIRSKVKMIIKGLLDRDLPPSDPIPSAFNSSEKDQ